jgi:hypothetical protein
VPAREPSDSCRLDWTWGRHVSRRLERFRAIRLSKPMTSGPDKES